jgi:hypothetical protein
MDELKSLIGQNRALFDTAEPSDGHFERFEKMLKAQETKRLRVDFRTLLRVAVITVLVTLSGLYITEHFIWKPAMHQNIQANEFREAQQYYTNMVNLKIDEIKNLDQQMNPQQKEMLLKELTQMDELFINLQKDLKARPDDPRLIQAMIKHYQMKVDVLNRIINNLNNVEQLKTQNHENVNL